MERWREGERERRRETPHVRLNKCHQWLVYFSPVGSLTHSRTSHMMGECVSVCEQTTPSSGLGLNVKGSNLELLMLKLLNFVFFSSDSCVFLCVFAGQASGAARSHGRHL